MKSRPSRTFTQWFSVPVLLGALLLPACGGDSDTTSSSGDASDANAQDVADGAEADTSGGSDDTSSEDTGVADVVSDDTGTVDSGAEDTGSQDAATEDTGTADTALADMTNEDTGAADAAEMVEPTLTNGQVCTSDDECLSGSCYIIGFLGGQCGNCKRDSDCPDGGCSAHDPRGDIGSVCNRGDTGGGCESTEVCQEGLFCAVALKIGPTIEVRTCGECRTDDDCDTEGQICAPIVIISDFTGQRTCIDQNVLEQDVYCDLDGNGDDACMSHVCSSVSFLDQANVGACGECKTSENCTGGDCQPGEYYFDDGTLWGSQCI